MNKEQTVEELHHLLTDFNSQYYNQAEAERGITSILIKMAKKFGLEPEQRRRNLKQVLGKLNDYEIMSIAQWILSNCGYDDFQKNNKYWKHEVYGYILEALVKDYLKFVPDTTTSLANMKTKNKKSKGNKIDYQRAKRELLVTNLCEEYGVVLKPKGNNLMIGLCPFHSEKTPSFTVYLDSNDYHCFGCGEHGDSINLLQHFKNRMDIKEWL